MCRVRPRRTTGHNLPHEPIRTRAHAGALTARIQALRASVVAAARPAMTRCRSRLTIRTGTTTTGSTTPSAIRWNRCTAAMTRIPITKTTFRSSRTTTRCTTMRRARSRGNVAGPSRSSRVRCSARLAPTRIGAIPAGPVRPSRRPSSPLTVRPRPRSSPRRPAIRNRARRCKDRLATIEREQLVSKQEEPVALSARAAVCRLRSRRRQAGLAAQPSVGSESRRRSAPVTIRPDGSDASGKPAGMAPPAAPGPARDGDNRLTARPAATPPAPARRPRPRRRAAARPICLEPQAGGPRPPASAAAARRSRTAPRGERGERICRAAVVAEDRERGAITSFRSLQAKFPNELGSRQPIIRRADLGSKGVFYRTMVGPVCIGPGGEPVLRDTCRWRPMRAFLTTESA